MNFYLCSLFVLRGFNWKIKILTRKLSKITKQICGLKEIKHINVKKSDLSHIDHITKYIKSDETILEVGSSYGKNLSHFHKETGAKVYGTEPSRKAISFGKKKYPFINFINGTINDTNLPPQKFNHVILGFCLYIIDYKTLPLITFQVDRLLKPGGFVHIFDFDSKYPQLVPYTHDNRIQVNKMDFSNIFTVYPNYFLVEKGSWSHQANMFSHDQSERCSTTTIFKEINRG